MTALRQRLIDEIALRGFSIHTRDAYVRFVAGLAKFYKRSPDQITDPEIKSYLLHLLRDQELATRSMLVAVSARCGFSIATSWAGPPRPLSRHCPE